MLYDDPTDLFADHAAVAELDLDGSFAGFTFSRGNRSRFLTGNVMSLTSSQSRFRREYCKR